MHKFTQRSGDIGQWIRMFIFGEFYDDPEFLKFKDQLTPVSKPYANALYKEYKKALNSDPVVIATVRSQTRDSGAAYSKAAPPSASDFADSRKSLPFIVEIFAVLFLMLGVGLAADSLRFITYTNGFVQFIGVSPIKAAFATGLIATGLLILVHCLRLEKSSSANEDNLKTVVTDDKQC